MNKRLSITLASLSTAILLVSPVLAQIDWNHEFTDDSSPALPFTSGGLFPANPVIEGGYALQADSAQDPGGDHVIPTLIRFDDDGNELWQARLDAGADSSSPHLLSAPTDSGRFLATYKDENAGTFKFGRFDGTTLSPVFEKELTPRSGDLTLLQSTIGLSSKIMILENQGAEIRFAVFSADGTEDFDVVLTSSIFTATTGQTTQLVAFAQLPDESGYTVSVHRSDFTIVGGLVPTVVYENIVTTVFLDLSGNVTETNSFEFSTPAPPTVLNGAVQDNAVLYRIIEINPTTGASDTRLVTIAPDGNLEWSAVVPGVSLTAQNVTSTANEVYLSGNRTTQSSSAGVIARVNLNDGSLLSSAVLDSTVAQSATVIGVTATNIFFQTVRQSGEAFVTGIGRLDRNLTNPIFRETAASEDPAIALFDPIADNVVVSVFADSTITAVSLGADLQATASDCGLFSDSNITVTSMLSAGPAISAPVAASVFAITFAGTIADITIPVSNQFAVNQEICDAPPTPGTPASAFTISFAEGNTDEIVLSWPTELGVSYTLNVAESLTGDFTALNSIEGDGEMAEVVLNAPASGDSFWYLSPGGGVN